MCVYIYIYIDIYIYIYIYINTIPLQQNPPPSYLDADIIFEISFSSLQVASRVACSVASLSLVPNHYLPGHHNLHCKVFADHKFDCGELSACAVALTEIQFCPPPFPEGTGVELPVRGKELGRDIPLQTRQVGFGHKCYKALVLKPGQSHV
jgi:hypothetical protein